MQKYGYESYEDYRRETNARPPRTLEGHRRKLNGQLETLYRQGDFRSLEAILKLAETLAATEDGTLTLDLYCSVLDMTQASETVRAVVCSILTHSKEKPKRSGRALEGQ